MFLKCLVLFLAISSVPLQTEAQTSQIQDVIAEWNDLLQRILEIYDGLQELSEVDLAEVIGDLATIEQLTNAVLFLLDTFSENLPDEAVCLMRVLLTIDAETQEQVVELVQEVVNYYRLTRERNELSAECDAIDTSSLSGTAQHQACRARLQSLNLQVANSNAKIRLQVVGLRDTVFQGTACLSIGG